MSEPGLPKPRVRVMAAWKLKEQMDEGWLSLNAEYQREIKWNKEKMGYLIDSIFTNYYIPPLLFAINKVRAQHIRTAIDGKQRLTAINRFMNNEIPYLHHETNQEKYYCKTVDEDDGRTYLTEEELEVFNTFEFLCIEYTNITVDQEYELFSRVQLGVTITNQERLKAHNTPVAKICREITETYDDLKEYFATKSELTLFQTVLHMFLTLKNDVANFESSLLRLFKFIKSDDELPEEHTETVKLTLSTLLNIAKDEKHRHLLTERNGAKSGLKTIDVLLFMMFRKEGSKLSIGKETFAIGMRFVSELLDNENLMPFTRPEVRIIEDDSDSDELKQEEYNEPSPSPVPAPVKRRRTVPGKPTARRGGKAPRK
ncbi:hypothetical protein MFLAVUS_001313 [Mucor flavus]|uniref:GmrSD restriction endonucleases N-terminal domain-containing protein n=1 Tax=Mucor flavus TaxID=439312 RepID=A0ABP9YM42_9FUNG